MLSKIGSIVLSLFLILINTNTAFACELCTIPNIGKHRGVIAESTDKKWFFKYLFENQNWHEKEGREGHNLHHDGHHFHNKTNEYIHHFGFGGRLTDTLTVTMEIPYVIRELIEIDDHAILGSDQKSEGLGDIHVVGLYKFWENDNATLEAVGGVKFPTGKTKEKNSIGTLFETELQPGSGSDDYILGAVLQKQLANSHITSNLIYVIKTEGTQNYEFGDSLIASLLWERPFQLKNGLNMRAGIDTSLQYEQKHKDHGSKLDDSGGVTLLIGPVVTVDFTKNLSAFASVSLPAFQDLGGVHQELDYVWTGGAKLNF